MMRNFDFIKDIMHPMNKMSSPTVINKSDICPVIAKAPHFTAYDNRYLVTPNKLNDGGINNNGKDCV